VQSAGAYKPECKQAKWQIGQTEPANGQKKHQHLSSGLRTGFVAGGCISKQLSNEYWKLLCLQQTEQLCTKQFIHSFKVS